MDGKEIPMTPECVSKIGRDAMMTAFLLAAPPLMTALFVGLVVSIFQAVTQILVLTLALIPKMLAVRISLFVAYAWRREPLPRETMCRYA